MVYNIASNWKKNINAQCIKEYLHSQENIWNFSEFQHPFFIQRNVYELKYWSKKERNNGYIIAKSNCLRITSIYGLNCIVHVSL